MHPVIVFYVSQVNFFTSHSPTSLSHFTCLLSFCLKILLLWCTHIALSLMRTFESLFGDYRILLSVFLLVVLPAIGLKESRWM